MPKLVFGSVYELKYRDFIARAGEWNYKEQRAPTPNILFLEAERIKKSVGIGNSSQRGNLVKVTEIEGLPSNSSHFSSYRRYNFLYDKKFRRAEISVPAHEFADGQGIIRLPLSCEELLDGSDEKKEGYVRVIHRSGTDVIKEVDTSPHLYALAHALELSQKPSRLVETLLALRTHSHSESLIYAPGLGKPHHIALLAYLGVDLFDSVPLIISAAKNIRLSTDGALSPRFKCHCQGCEESGGDFQSALEHNCYAALAEVGKVGLAIEAGRLREVVESRVRSEAWLVSCLRTADLKHYDYFMQYVPATGACFAANSAESLHRPDIIHYRNKLRDYKKPDSASVLLLIPCSARKPYSASKSHKRISGIIERAGCRSLLHEVIITSPLGIVPREFEVFYPAQHYDIPVTGHWSMDEKEMVLDMVNELLRNNSYDEIILHLPGNYDFIIDAVEGTVTVDGGTTGPKSLDNLMGAIKPLRERYGIPDKQERFKEDMRNRILFQFGEDGLPILDGVKIKGRYPHLKIIAEGNTQVGMLNPDRALISLTVEGGRRLLAENAYWVEIDDFELAGTIFAVGVKEADPRIRVGDEVAIRHNGDLKGVGRAMMCAKDMVECSRGAAVKVRAKARSA